MKSIIIRHAEFDTVLIHIKRTKTGVDVTTHSSIGPLDITCVMENNKRIKIRTGESV